MPRELQKCYAIKQLNFRIAGNLSDQHRFVGFIATAPLFPEGVNKKVVSKYLAFAFVEGLDFNQRFLFGLW